MELRARAERLAVKFNTAPATELPQLAAEPLQAFCSRRRSGNDYAYAHAELHDPLAFAEALAFLPDDWVEPKRPIGQANWLFLKAEGLPAGDPRRAEWIGRALTIWDSAQCGVHLEECLAETLREFPAQEIEAAAIAAAPGAPPLTLATLREGVDTLLLTLAEEALAEIGCDTEDPTVSKAGAAWVELLCAVERMRRLPQPEGVSAAEQRLIRRLQRPAEEFADIAGALGLQDCYTGGLSALDLPTPGAAQIHGLISSLRKVRTAAALASKRPSLASALTAAGAIFGLDALRVLAAWTIGVRVGAWTEAAELLNGVDRDAVEKCDVSETRHTMRLACAVIPALAAVQASGGADARLVDSAGATLAGLRREFPRLSAIIEQLERSVHSSKPGAPEGATEGGTAAPAGTAKSPAKTEAEQRRGSAAAQAPPGDHPLELALEVPRTREDFAGARVDKKRAKSGAMKNAGASRRAWPQSPAFWRVVAQAAACVALLVGFVWFFARSTDNPRAGDASPAATDRVSSAASTAALAPPRPRAAAGKGTAGTVTPDDDPGMARFTDTRGRTYRVPISVLGDLQTEARAIERKRLQVEEMRASLEAYKARLEADRRAHGGSYASSSSQISLEAKAEGIRRERELVREQERVLQSMIDEHQGHLGRL